MNVKVRAARQSDTDRLARMFAALWPKTPVDDHAQEIRLILAGEAQLTMPITILVAETSSGDVVGFVEADLRSHADGCDPAQPVGYIEGWYVEPAHRQLGLGAQLIASAEEWARSHRCIEIASDAVIDNVVSHHAHEALGFEVVDRCVHYRKKL